MKTLCCGEDLLLTKDSDGKPWKVCVWCGYGEEDVPIKITSSSTLTIKGTPFSGARGKVRVIKPDRTALDCPPPSVNTYTEEGQEKLRKWIKATSIPSSGKKYST